MKAPIITSTSLSLHKLIGLTAEETQNSSERQVAASLSKYIMDGELPVTYEYEEEITANHPMGFSFTIAANLKKVSVLNTKHCVVNLEAAINRETYRVDVFKKIIIQRDDFSAYLDKHKILKPTFWFSEEKTSESGQTVGWKKKAREYGEAYIKEQQNQTGKIPSQDKIAKYLEGKLLTENIKGARGKFQDHNTIRREALRGITGRKPNGQK